jgi:hypothetical protein
MSREDIPGGYEDGEADEDLIAFQLDAAVEKYLNGATGVLSWTLQYSTINKEADEGITISAVNSKKWVYVDRRRWLDVDKDANASPLTSPAIYRQETNATVMEVNLYKKDPYLLGSRIVLLATHSGVIAGYRARRKHTFMNLLEDAGALQARMTGHKPMVDREVGEELQKAFRFFENERYKDLSEDDQRMLEESFYKIDEYLDYSKGQDLFDEQVAANLATTINSTTETYGSEYSGCTIKVTTENDNEYELAVDPNETDGLGINVRKYIHWDHGFDPGDEKSRPVIYYMNDGRLIYMSELTGEGPDAYRKRMVGSQHANIVVRDVTTDDLKKFYELLTEGIYDIAD